MTRRDVLGVLVAWLAVACASLPFLAFPAHPDEGGYLQIASQWDIDEPHAYGHYWVDRPPLLLLIFRVGFGLDGLTGVRLLSLAGIGVAIAAACVIGRQVAGPRGAVAATVVSAALCACASLGTFEVDGEILAVPFVLTSIALVLHARASESARIRIVLGLVAGASAACALLIKQNLADAFVWALVLLAYDLWVGRGTNTHRTWLLLASGAAGAVGVFVSLGAWAHWLGPGVDEVAYALYGFRLDAGVTISSGDTSADTKRAWLSLLMAVVSGLAAWVMAGLVYALRHLRHGPDRGPALALAALIGFDLLSVLAGGSFWFHYLIEFVPAAVLTAAAVARAQRLTLWLVATVVLTVVNTSIAAAIWPQTAEMRDSRALVTYLDTHRHPRDTALVTYSHANVLWSADMASPYPYLWSLPTRVLDPRLRELTSIVQSSRAPTWIVAWENFDEWGLDPHHWFSDAVGKHYRPVAHVCGHVVWLRRGVVRPGPPLSCG